MTRPTSADPLDLTTVPTPALYAELARRRGCELGRKPKLSTCPRCGKLLTASEARRRCPGHSLAAVERMER